MRASCLCGQITLTIDGPFEHAPEACHCGQCRKHSGHYLVAVNVRRDALHVSGEEHVRWYESSDKVRRGFCGTCGSTLFWDPMIEGYQYTAVALGLFDEPTGLRIAKHTFVGDKGDYYDLPDDAVVSDGF